MVHSTWCPSLSSMTLALASWLDAVVVVVILAAVACAAVPRLVSSAGESRHARELLFGVLRSIAAPESAHQPYDLATELRPPFTSAEKTIREMKALLAIKTWAPGRNAGATARAQSMKNSRIVSRSLLLRAGKR
jgi:hypothetical protein